jgi:hypothetical protein
MPRVYDFLAITITRTSGNWYIETVKPDNSVTVQQGRDAFAVMKELTSEGWEIVSNLTFSDGKPNLVFRRPAVDTSADEQVETIAGANAHSL